MKKHFLAFIALILAAQTLWAEIKNNTPTTSTVLGTTYYSAANNKSGSALFSALTTISGGVTYSYNKLTYDELYTAYHTSDVYPSGHTNVGKIWDMYSTVLWTPGDKECGNYSGEGGCYNREHSMPKSWFGGSSNYKSTNQGCDLVHLVPTDGYVNSQRSNYAFGEVASASYTSNGGLSKLGSSKTSLSVDVSTISGTSVSVSGSPTVFEPADEYKGDFARIYMYMRARYASLNLAQADGGTVHFSTTTSPASDSKYGFKDYSVILLMKWHRQDPVSQKEIDRNNAIEKMQGNRNPFVDYPILAEYLWGKYAGETFSLDNAVGSFSSNFTVGVSDGDKSGSGSGEEGLPAYMAPPTNYYVSVEGLQDASLKSALGTLSHTGTRLVYGKGSKNSTWYGFFFTDRDTTDNSVIDMYSNTKRYFSTTDSTASVEGCHIEHMLPKSWWGGDDNDAYKDLYHLVPADGSANSSKSNWGPGVPDMTYSTAFDNGRFYTSRDVIHGLTRCFAPADEFKGDFARAYFYVVTTYGDEFTWVDAAITAGMTNDSYLEFQDWLAELLMEWHRSDPVSEKEIRRAYAVNKIQGNRNPFIDYPCLAEFIWGNRKGEAVHMSELVSGYEGKGTDCCGSSEIPTTKYTITWSKNGVTSTTQVAEGTRPTPPSVDDCSTTRVFRGWTTNSSYSGNGSNLMKVQADFPAASANATYYAVYADKEGSGSSDDYTLYSGSLTEGDYIVYYGGKAMKATVSSGRLDYEEESPTNNKITTTDASIIWHIAASGNYWTIYNAGVKKYAAGTEVKNKAQLLDSGTDDKSLWTCLLVDNSTKYEFINKANAAAGVNDTLRNNGSYGFACYAASTGGALSLYKAGEGATYSNYSTQCSATPQVTITFHKNDGSSTTTTQQVPQNTSTALNANPWSRTHFTFLGWATSASGEKVYNDGQNVTISAALDLYAVWKEDDKYTVKWHTAGETTSVVYYTGTNLALPSTPADCEKDVRVFKGWTAQSGYKHATSAPSDLFTSASGTVTANADYYAVYADKEVEKEPILVTDTLTCVLINQSNYGDWTGKTSYTSAVYAGNTGGELKYIQMRASSNSGIVTTTSGGVVRRIELKWKSNTTSGRTIDVYGKKSAYSSAADLYSSEAATKGALLGSIAYGTSTALDIKVDSTYIGLRSSGNALYVDTIAIVWKTGENVTTTYSNYSTKCTAKVIVTFHKNDGSDVTTTQEISEGKATALTANPWSRTHYTFEGWATSASGEKVYDDEQSVTIDADLDLYALWTEDPKYTVTCYSNGAKVDEVKGYAGEEIVIYDPEACEGYTFVGWSTTTCPTEVTQKPQTHVLTTIPDHDVTYYAIFGRQIEGGSTVTNDYKKITTSEELTTANYVIVAYYNDGNSNLYGAMSTNWKDNFYLAPVTVTPNDQDIVYTKEGTIIWNITVVEGLVAISNETAGNLYVEQSTSGTYYNIKLGDNTTENKFTHSVTSGNWLFTSAVYTDRVLEFYAGAARWAIYKSADAPIYLYKQIVEEGHTTYYVSSPSCSGGTTAVENTVDSITPRKVLIGSEMYIFIGEHCYDVTGKRIR